MAAIYNDYKSCRFAIDGSAKIANEFNPLEKAAKIAYRTIDLVDIALKKLPLPYIVLSTQLKELILTIESTRFFCVSFPLFFKDKEGKSFFQTRTGVQFAEKVSITLHLALKTLFGADRVGLIRLGIIGSYAIGHLTVFRWLLEGFVLMFNFFGAWDGSRTLIHATNKLRTVQAKIDRTNSNQLTLPPLENPKRNHPPAEIKQRKWELIKKGQQFDQMKGLLKIGATVGKIALISFATGIAACNIWNIPCHMTILTLGIISDGIGLAAIFHQEYFYPKELYA